MSDTIAEATDEWRARVEQLRETLCERPAEPPAEMSLEEAEAHERRWTARIPLRYRHARVDQLEGDAAEAASWDGRSNVLLVGNIGAGKTHAAVALARLAHDQGREVLFRSAVGLLDELRPDGPPDAFKRSCTVDVLVLDDLGSERRTDWTADRVSAVLVARYDDCRPTIVTSNLSPEALEVATGVRIYSRLYDDALRVRVSGDDRRRADA